MAGSERASQRFQGHIIHGPADALRAFSHLDTGTQGHYLREAQHYGATKVVLSDVAWELKRQPNHQFELVMGVNHTFI